MKNILFFAYQDDSFLKPIVNALGKTGKYNIQIFKENQDPQIFWDLFRWSDICWVEWCNESAVTLSQMPQAPKVIIRLQSYEIFTQMPQQVNWSNIDMLIFTNESVRQIFQSKIKGVPPTAVIPNVIEIDKFPMHVRAEYGKNVGYAGYINYKKNPQLLLYLFHALYQYDKGFKFFVKGNHQDERIKIYWDNLLSKMDIPILVEPFDPNMQKWYERMDYIVSPSLFESFNYVMAEGMLSGCMPLIHSWYGSDLIYPQKYIWNFTEDAIKIIEECKGKEKFLAIENRDFIKERYDINKILPKYEEIFDIL